MYRLCVFFNCTACHVAPGCVQSYEDLKEHLKSDVVKKFIEFTAKEKIPIFTTPVYVIE